MENNYKATNFKKFDLGLMISNPSICIIGKRSVDKINLIISILNNINLKEKDEKDSLIISPLKESYLRKTKNFKIAYQYDPQLVEDSLEISKKHHENKLNDRKTVIVLDDCFPSNYDWNKDNPIVELYLYLFQM